MEQQFPWGQFPQMVLPLPVPHVPSVVTAAVDVCCAGIVEVTGAMTGSPELVDEDETRLWLELLDPAQPFWHPFETRQ